MQLALAKPLDNGYLLDKIHSIYVVESIISNKYEIYKGLAGAVSFTTYLNFNHSKKKICT